MKHTIGRKKKFINISEGEKTFKLFIKITPLDKNTQYNLAIRSSEDIMQDNLDLERIDGKSKMIVSKTNTPEDWFLIISAPEESKFEIEIEPTSKTYTNDLKEDFFFKTDNLKKAFPFIFIGIILLAAVGIWFFKRKHPPKPYFGNEVTGAL